MVNYALLSVFPQSSRAVVVAIGGENLNHTLSYSRRFAFIAPARLVGLADRKSLLKVHQNSLYVFLQLENPILVLCRANTGLNGLPSRHQYSCFDTQIENSV